MKQTTRAAKSRMTAVCLLLAGMGLVSPGQGQTRINLQHQSRAANFSALPSTKPFATGTILPSVCSVGEVFFKSDAVPGSNLFLCGAANLWTATQADAVVAPGESLTAGFVVKRPGATELKVGTCSPDSPCVYAFTTTIRTLNEPAVLTLASGSGTVMGYLDRSAGLTVSVPSGMSISCSNCLTVANVATFPPDSIPLFRWTATSGVWNLEGLDLRPTLRREVLVAGDNVTLAHNGDHVVISAAVAAGDIAAEQKQGSGPKLVTSGSVTASRCAEWDATGTLVSSAGACGGGGGGASVPGTGIVKATDGVLTATPTIGAADIAATDKQGAGSKLVTAGTVTPNRCAQFDANGTLVSATGACGSSGGGAVAGIRSLKFQPVVCTYNGGLTTGDNVSFPTSGAPTAGADCNNGIGASTMFGSTGSPTLYVTGVLPPDWVAGTGWSFSASWFQIDGGAASTTVRFRVAAACTGAIGDTSNALAFTAETPLDVATPATTNTFTVTSAADLPLPVSCAAGKLISIRVKRDNTITGNYSGAARLSYGSITY